MLLTITGTVIIFIGIVLLYALAIRPWIRKTAWGQAFLAKIEPLEIVLFKKSETVLVGRMVWFGGLIVSAYDVIAQFARSLDLTPVTTRIFDALHIPPDLRGLTTSAAVMGLGLIIVKLRKDTTKPLALVEAPANSPASVAVAKADVANVQAVQAVKATS